ALFRAGRLLLLLEVLHEIDERGKPDIERLSIYDFFSDNPHLALSGDQDHADRTRLALIGFSREDLSYQSSGHRFSSRRARMEHDLARLVSLGAAEAVVVLGHVTYRINEAGREAA